MYLQEYYNIWGTERLSQSFYNAGLTISYRDSLVLSKAFLSNWIYSYICDKYTPLLWQSNGKRSIKIVEIFQLLSSCVWTLFTWTSLRLGLFRAFLCCGVTAFFTGPGLSALMIRIVRISFKVQFSSYIWTNQLQHNTISNDWWGGWRWMITCLKLPESEAQQTGCWNFEVQLLRKLCDSEHREN